MLTALVLSSMLGRAAHSIAEVTPTNFHSASFRARKTAGSPKELGKINDDFALSYRFAYSDVKMKEPFKLRLESRVEDTSILFVVNGTRKMARAPRSNINVKENVATKPGKRQTVLDFGLLAPSLWSDLFDANFVRIDRETGAYVFDLFYKAKFGDKTRHRIWASPTMKTVLKREWYSQFDGGRLMATFSYSGFVEKAGVFFPTKYAVRNADGKVAGQSMYENISVNGELSDSLFEIK